MWQLQRDSLSPRKEAMVMLECDICETIGGDIFGARSGTMTVVYCHHCIDKGIKSIGEQPCHGDAQREQFSNAHMPLCFKEW